MEEVITREPERLLDELIERKVDEKMGIDNAMDEDGQQELLTRTRKLLVQSLKGGHEKGPRKRKMSSPSIRHRGQRTKKRRSPGRRPGEGEQRSRQGMVAAATRRRQGQGQRHREKKMQRQEQRMERKQGQ